MGYLPAPVWRVNTSRVMDADVTAVPGYSSFMTFKRIVDAGPAAAAQEESPGLSFDAAMGSARWQAKKLPWAALGAEVFSLT